MRVFATSRALRNYYSTVLSQDQLIEKAISIGELFSKIVLVPHRTFVDNQTRLLLLAKASEFDHFMKLQIDRDLFSFLHNSDYIFRFYEELAGEKITIDDIDCFDTYEEYTEHLTILKELLERYKALLEAQSLIDTMFVPQSYLLNSAYLEGIGSLHIELEGYLTAFELELLLEASQSIPVTITFYANKYNKKLQERFNSLGFVLESGNKYQLNIGDRVITDQQKYETHINSHTQSFSERILQVGFIKKKVHEFVFEKKIDPSEIVVILPDESFASSLALYDTHNNFNLAMGLPFSETLFMKRLQAISYYFEHNAQEQKHRLKRYIEGIESAFEVMRLHYSEVISMELFGKIIDLFSMGIELTHKELIDEALFSFIKLKSMLEGATLKVYLKLFMQRLSKMTIDDVRGGKITVMGLLETRGSTFKGVIVVDFNDEYIPKKSQKDLFLSSAIKAHAGLPTSKDREALQKYFYQRLFENAQEVALSYVSSETQLASKFLTELGIKKAKPADESGYAAILYAPHEAKEVEAEIDAVAYDFRSRPLSATALKSFLECKRRFYYRYIHKFKAHEVPQDLPQEKEVGIWLHDLLQEVYSEKRYFEDTQTLKKAIEKAFETHKSKGEMGRYLVRLWLERLEPFYTSEIERFSQGYQVYAVEKELTIKHHGITLTGKIDRIDTRDGMLSIIDYKSGSITPDATMAQVEKSSEFQMEFYTLLAQSLGEVEDANYYELKSGRLNREMMLAQKLERLETILDGLAEVTQFTPDQTDNHQQCRYCDYKILCGRA